MSRDVGMFLCAQGANRPLDVALHHSHVAGESDYRVRYSIRGWRRAVFTVGSHELRNPPKRRGIGADEREADSREARCQFLASATVIREYRQAQVRRLSASVGCYGPHHASIPQGLHPHPRHARANRELAPGSSDETRAEPVGGSGRRSDIDIGVVDRFADPRGGHTAQEAEG